MCHLAEKPGLSSAKNKGKSIESPVAEAKSSSEEIHVTESEAEILREPEINTPTVIVKKRNFWDEFLVAEGFQGTTSKKKMGHPKNMKKVNPQDEELEKEVSSQTNSENSLEHEELGNKSSFSSRLTQSSTRK